MFYKLGLGFRGLGFRDLSLDPPCTLNWGYMVPNNGYLGPPRG